MDRLEGQDHLVHKVYQVREDHKANPVIEDSWDYRECPAHKVQPVRWVNQV